MNEEALLKKGDAVGIISCSDGLSRDSFAKVKDLEETLKDMGLRIKYAKTIYRSEEPFSGNPQSRAEELMRLYLDSEIKAIFDISGGDSTNQILDCLDCEAIRENPKAFFGISDLSVLLNALYEQANMTTYHYKIRNLIGEDGEKQKRNFIESFFRGKKNIYDFKYRWIRGERMQGVVIGGNIRCFLKLVGSRYLPNPKGKLLFLEALGGGATRVASLLAQLKYIGYLESISGIILGTFSYLESSEEEIGIEELILDISKGMELPIIKTQELGHGEDGKCIVIGRELEVQ